MHFNHDDWNSKKILHHQLILETNPVLAIESLDLSNFLKFIRLRKQCPPPPPSLKTQKFLLCCSFPQSSPKTLLCHARGFEKPALPKPITIQKEFCRLFVLNSPITLLKIERIHDKVRGYLMLARSTL